VAQAGALAGGGQSAEGCRVSRHFIRHSGRWSYQEFEEDVIRLVLFLLSVPGFQQVRRPQSVYVIRARQILDVSSMAMASNVTLVVQNGIITGRFASDSVVGLPTGAAVIDLTRYTVMAGLIDAHVHFALGGTPRDNARKTVEAGFTTVADLGSSAYATVRLRDLITRDSLIGPSIIAAGSWIGGRGGVCEFGGATIRGRMEARAQARADIAAGAALLKVCVTGWFETAITHPDSLEMTSAELEAIRIEAASAGVPLVAHAIGSRGAARAVDAGVRLLAHTPLADSLIAARLAAEGVCVASTLSTVPEGAPRRAADAALRRLRDAGVRIMVGTDAGVLEHGRNATELIALQKLGFSEPEILRAATSVPAACLRIAFNYGDLQVGSEASIIGTSGSPLDDITVLEQPVFVMVRGKVVRDVR
jgi:imidazolonepropionase-like amidohydrolase